jgi:hypothetical protein
MTSMSGFEVCKPACGKAVPGLAKLLLSRATESGVHMRSAKLSLMAVAVLAVGCERSAVNPEDAITVQGTLQDAAGMPRASANAKLYRGPPRVSGGTCPLLLGSPWKQAITGADGKYSFTFTGKDSQTGDVLGTSEGGNLARCFRVQSEAANQASVSADFTVQLTAVDAPVLRDYDAQLTVSGAASADFTWVAPAAGSKPESYALTLDTETGDPLWSKSASGGATNASVPDYVFEGLASKAQLVARGEERASGSIWPTRLESAVLSVAARGIAPLSRGGSCDLTAAPCPLTDGSFKPVTVDKDAVVVTFVAPLSLKRVLLRGLSGSGDRLVVETSTDGATYTSLADLAYASGFHDLESPSVLTAKSVRIKLVKHASSSGEAKISQLAEVSVVP